MSTPDAPEWAPVPEDLARLAEAYGVATEYWDQAGALVQVGAATVSAALTALGLDVSSAQAIEHGLEARRLRDWRRMLPPVFVMRQGDDQRLWVHVPDGTPVAVSVDLEDGGRVDLAQLDLWVDPVDVDGVRTGEASFRVPGDLPLGWHTAVAVADGVTASAPVVVAPRRLDPDALVGDRQWGFMTQLYAMRSSHSWGLGDLHDLGDLAAWSGGELGAGFVLINPLHAASPVPPMAPSPYLPVTRRFTNPLYLHVEDIPELVRVPADVAAEIAEAGRILQQLNASEDLLDRDSVWAAKRASLWAIHRVGMDAGRAGEYDAFVRSQGAGLVDFATWCAISDVHGHPSRWPAGLERPDSAGVVAFRGEHADLIDFHMWMQWQVDDQLGSTQQRAVDAGMRIGVISDLAVGVHPDGADAWALQSVLAPGVGVGAPPDMYNQMGQNWHQPPWRPDALAEQAFVPFRDMLRTVLRNAGGLRIDHVLGLFRLWWVPSGFPAYAGTFVRFDHDAMLSILMLEAHRAGAVIIGEDLGTVEPWVQEALLERGILGTSILWFENAGGGPKDPHEWRRDVLASVTVHDLPPTAGYLRDEHVRIRSELGLLSTPVEEERAHAAAERAGWADLLRRQGWLAWAVNIETDAGLDEFAVALHRALAASPARLLGIGLPDVVGDRRAQNQPGTDQEYPNWRVPLADASGRSVLLDEVMQGSALMDGMLGPVR